MAKSKLILAAAMLLAMPLSMFSSAENHKVQNEPVAELKEVEVPMLAYELQREMIKEKAALRKAAVLEQLNTEAAQEVAVAAETPEPVKAKATQQVSIASASKTPPVKTLEAAATTQEAEKGEWMEFTATFYNLGYASTGKRPGDDAYGITYSGRPVEDGITISVDKRVIPVVREGKGDPVWVEVKYEDGRIERRRADDTGSAIKGRKVDIFAAQPDEVLYGEGYGKQKVLIRIIHPKKS